MENNLPVEEITEGFFRSLWGIVKYFIVEIIIEIGIRFPGYVIIKYIWYPSWKRKIDSDSISVFIAGVIFWLLAIFLFVF